MPPTNADGPWRTRGAPHYLDAQAARLGVPGPAIIHPRVRDNRQLAKIAGQLGQLQRDYWSPATPKYGDERQYGDMQAKVILGILDTCEGEVGKVHAIAAAAGAMVDEAWHAFGWPPPDRGFRIVVASESPAESVEVAAPPAVTDHEVASLRSEIDQLRRENEALAERLTEPAAKPVPSTAPNPHHRRTPAGS